MQVAVAVTLVVGVEELGQGNTNNILFITGLPCSTVIKIAAAYEAQGAQQRRQRMSFSQGISDLFLFPVCQGTCADA